MQSLIKRFFLATFIVASSQPVLASDDISFTGGVAYNWKNEDFKIGGKPFKPEFTTVDWSLISSYKSSFVKVNYDQSIKDSFQIDNGINGGGNASNQAIFFGREDIGLTIGYNVLDSVAVFTGYTRGETKGVGTGEVFNEGSGPIYSTLSVSIIEKGPFLGASYSYYLQDSGSLSFIVAYARLDGKVSISRADKLISTQSTTFDNQTAKGDADGLSYAIIWTNQFSENSLYHISLKTTNYKFNAPEVVSQDSYDFNDTYTIFSIGFSRFF